MVGEGTCNHDDGGGVEGDDDIVELVVEDGDSNDSSGDCDAMTVAIVATVAVIMMVKCRFPEGRARLFIFVQPCIMSPSLISHQVCWLKLRNYRA